MATNPESNKYKPAGLIFIIGGLLFNPWLIGWITGYSFSSLFLVGIFAVSLIIILSGIGLRIKQKDFFLWISGKYQNVAVILLNILILFGLVNVLAIIMMKKPVEAKSEETSFYSPQELYSDSIGFMRSVYPGKSDEDINELLLLTSPYANHPVLEFQERIQVSKHYNTGFEGIRFDNRVTRQNAPQKINGAVWVMGGSTTFGQGVSDNETISAYLNQLDTSHTYINFGVHAFHQTNEINKLILLLKKGYQPEKVIFIDGLNDLIRMIETNFHPLETPSLAKSAYTSDYNIATKAAANSFLRQLPVTRWLRSFVDEKDEAESVSGLPWDKYDDVYSPDNLYNKDPKQHFKSTLLRNPYNAIDTSGLKYIVWKLRIFYNANYRFIEKLAQAYGFEFAVYYQPQGVLAEQNPFWKDQLNSRQSPLYRNFDFVIPQIRKQIADWNLPYFYDIAQVQDSCPGCYVDLTHYNPELNRKIAEAILQTSISGN